MAPDLTVDSPLSPGEDETFCRRGWDWDPPRSAAAAPPPLAFHPKLNSLKL